MLTRVEKKLLKKAVCTCGRADWSSFTPAQPVETPFSPNNISEQNKLWKWNHFHEKNFKISKFINTQFSNL